MSKQQFLAENQLEGEIYAGLILGKDSAPDYHLFLRPEKPETELSWGNAMEWAKSIGYEIPTRREQSLLFANCRSEFEQSWHWSGEQLEILDSCFWMQNFSNGDQDIVHKSYTGRVRAVRRVYLEQT